jgi:hypothetical protein
MSLCTTESIGTPMLAMRQYLTDEREGLTGGEGSSSNNNNNNN